MTYLAQRTQANHAAFADYINPFNLGVYAGTAENSVPLIGVVIPNRGLFTPSINSFFYIRKCSPKYTRRTDSFAMMSSGRPLAKTIPWLMIYARSQTPSVSRTL